MSLLNPDDETVPCFDTSCTKDEAVAKMLGWMRGYQRKAFVGLDEYGVLTEDLPHLRQLDETLLHELVTRRSNAKWELLSLFDADSEPDESRIEEKEAALAHWDNEIAKAGDYFAAIDDELAKDGSSRIRIDREKSERAGETHLTLKSLEQWSKDEYGIDINNLEANATKAKKDEKEDKKPRGSKAEQSLLVTLGLLVHALVKARSNRLSLNGKPNVLQIAKDIEALSLELANGRTELEGQGHEAIKKRIGPALEALESALRK